ncbi:MAG: transcription antitermination factor NusB [Rubrobacteraceae bacterium]
MSRRRGRKQAFLALFQGDINEIPSATVVERWVYYRGEFVDYARRLVAGVEDEIDDLDARLTEVSVGWPVHRMSAVDRTILRLALYEMLHVEDVPPEVAINEAVELAKGFSGEESPVFVSGVLRGAENQIVDKVEHG